MTGKWVNSRLVVNRGDGMKITSIILIITMAGCSAIASKTQQFSVTVDPDYAVIKINGQKVGVGTTVTQVKRDSTVSV